MLSIGDVHVYVSDFVRALRFWAEGLGLEATEKEVTPHSAYAVLDFPDGGPSLRLLGPVDPWESGARPAAGSRPTIRFDVTTTDFDGTLARLLDCGGAQLDEIEEYRGLRVVTVADPDGNSFELLEIPPGDAD
ncbi:Glyoxalase-like domain protein [Phycisphaerae bacterium RAS1]|nr:Glyoxalase-like domain protein [Phycisphaerae bacterium RAS1]